MEVDMASDASANGTRTRTNRNWLTIYGVGLILLGAFAIIAPNVFTIAAAVLLGWLLLASGIVGVIAMVRAGPEAPGFRWKVFGAVVCILAGIALIWFPRAGVLTLTIILAAYLLAAGLIKAMMALQYRSSIPEAWGLMLFTAIVDIALGIVIVAGITGAAVWLLGLLIGMSLVFTGVALLVAAKTLKLSGAARL
jgi:uncharacterized membrane protein HdeD (DUF308 family)